MSEAQSIKRVGIWIRVSTEDQAKGDSPEHHEKRARYYAESKGWKVETLYPLEAVSGKSVWEHPETKRMLQDIQTGKISGLIFSKLARLARNTRELLDFADVFRTQSADLISLQESIDTSTPAGRLFYTMIAGMAQWEREEIADRVAASVPIRAKLGKSLGGAAPFGYQWTEKKPGVTRQLIPDPTEAPIRRLMYELFQKHQRQRTVARLLNEAGHRTRNGSKFSGNTVLRLIEDPTAKGLHRANYSKSLGAKKHWVFKPEDQWIFQPVEAIVSEESWEDCNRILREQRQRLRPRKRKPVHLFTGFAVCVCGQKLYVPSNTPKYVCYKCRNKIPIRDLEAVFQEQLRNFAVSPQEILSYVEQSDQVIQEKKSLLETVITEQQKVSAEMQKVYRAYIDDRLDGEGFGRLYRPLELRLKQVEDQVPQLEAEIDFLKIQHLSQEQVLSDVQDLCFHWPTLEAEEKRNLIEAVLDEVIVGKDDVTFRLNYLPSFEERSVRMRTPSSSPKLVAELPRNVRGSSRRQERTMRGTSASSERGRL